MYLIAKHSHLMLITISVCFLIIRIIAVSFNADWVRKKWVKIAPHIIDTLLLLSAITLMITLSQYPLVDHWLTAKIFALIGYILFASMAFKGEKKVSTRLVFLAIALSFIIYMAFVAITKNPIPFL